MAGANTLAFDDANFEAEVLQAQEPVLVDFWAEWCGPCRMLGPVIDEIANDFAGKVKVGKVDITNSSGVAAQYGIQSIPTVIIFKDGQPAERITGARQKGDYVNLLNELVNA